MINQQIQRMILVFGVIIVFLLEGCQSEQPAPIQQTITPIIEIQSTATALSVLASPLNSPVLPTPQPTPTFPNPTSGQAAIRGGLISKTTQSPVGGTLIYLTPGLGQQKDEFPPVLTEPQKKDIQSNTDKQGWFTINNVPPGNYYLIIWAPLSWTPLMPAEGPNAGQPVKLKLEANQILDLGQMLVYWP